MRISRGKRVFSKEYEGGWTIELLKISQISTSRPPLVYYLRDLADEDIIGYYYEEEICRVRKNLDSEDLKWKKIQLKKGKYAANNS